MAGPDEQTGYFGHLSISSFIHCRSWPSSASLIATRRSKCSPNSRLGAGPQSSSIAFESRRRLRPWHAPYRSSKELTPQRRRPLSCRRVVLLHRFQSPLSSRIAWATDIAASARQLAPTLVVLDHASVHLVGKVLRQERRSADRSRLAGGAISIQVIRIRAFGQRLSVRGH